MGKNRRHPFPYRCDVFMGAAEGGKEVMPLDQFIIIHWRRMQLGVLGVIQR
jgi:hypothetical protein